MTEPLRPAEERIVLSPADRGARWADPLREAAARAWEISAQRLGLEPPSPVLITSFGSEWEFQQYLNSNPTHVVAVARPAQREIVILRPAWFSSTTDEQMQTLVHEMAHLVSGARYAGDVPMWLEEGLAMLAAGQNRYGYALRLTMAGTFGGVIPIEQLETSVLLGGESQQLAYAQSLSLTRFYLRMQYPEESAEGRNPAPLAAALADPERGPAILGLLRDPNFRRALDDRWRASQKSTWSWLAALSGGGFVWGLASVLFLLAGWRKRRFARQLRERMAEEDERDRELGLEIPPWEYEADDEDAGGDPPRGARRGA